MYTVDICDTYDILDYAEKEIVSQLADHQVVLLKQVRKPRCNIKWMAIWLLLLLRFENILSNQTAIHFTLHEELSNVTIAIILAGAPADWQFCYLHHLIHHNIKTIDAKIGWKRCDFAPRTVSVADFTTRFKFFL